MSGSLDLIMPLYHPHPGWDKPIHRHLTELEPFFRERGIAFRAFLVNDGSPLSDYDPELLRALKDAHPEFEFLSYEQNRGKGYCIRYGVNQSQADVQLYTDADFPFGVEPLFTAAEQLLAGDADVVMGTRSADYHAALTLRRKIISHAVRIMNRLLLFMPKNICDTQAGIKGFDAAGRRCFLATQTNSFLFDTEFIFYSHKAGLKIHPIPVELQKDLHFAQVGLSVILRETLNFGAIFLKSLRGGTPGGGHEAQ